MPSAGIRGYAEVGSFEMKLLVSSVVIAAVALGGVGSAKAADLPLKAPLPPAPVYSWTGFYVGGDVGVRGTQTDLHDRRIRVRGRSTFSAPPPSLPSR